MILRLIDRRTAGPGDPDEWFGPAEHLDLLAELAADLGCPAWNADLVLVDDDAMADLNAAFRRSEGVTDVLSFSYLENDGVGPPHLSRGEGRARSDLWVDRPDLAADNGPECLDIATAESVGEIVLAPRFVVDRGRRNGWPAAEEFPLLVVHGLLHLLGWEHETTEDRAAMQAVEREILARRGLPHPLLERS